MKHFKLGLTGIVLHVFLILPASLQADRFTIATPAGEREEVIGRIHGSGQGAIAIERRDGGMKLVAQGAVLERDNSVDWEPYSTDEMVEHLTEKFGSDLFRSFTDDHFVIGMVLMGPLERAGEGPATGFMRKAAQFMKNVQSVFQTFAKDMRLEIQDPETPLVLLIFESDDDFNKYAMEVTKGQGLSVSRISGFYDGMTNFLSIRMAECSTFEVPLHEAIHQQVYNRGLLKRLAPIPAWFNEGIATGFEANKDRIRSGPAKVHSRFAAKAPKVEQVGWDDLISEDLAFQGDVMAGDAYCLAWCLHWLLVNEHPKEYTEYVKMLSEKEPLLKEEDLARKREFEQFFGDDMESLKQEFILSLNTAMRRQRNVREEPQKAGYYYAQQGLADIELSAISRTDRGGLLELEGRIRNINPLRSLTFSVSVVTDGGNYAQWILPDVDPNRIIRLPKKYAQEALPGLSPQPSNSFRVNIRSVIPESTEGQSWQRGNLPDPTKG
ncbi:DUF1570 domain-containing protein [Rubinisphaera italica]|uniref:DUF1570 domain-containing protein n=1 Tax=Rubinisphaera italica TaxID=2527969 RepID=A0A5C5XPV9_9PLAN|nr:DUF1570 domain-containing protein [Rubinisphaera italica]TWT64105.1 hypothetical protein Pan54_48660 [Rubinisphaera italica]